jgi:hypothetical protein
MDRTTTTAAAALALVAHADLVLLVTPAAPLGALLLLTATPAGVTLAAIANRR